LHLKVLTVDSYGRQHDTFELDILGHIKSQTPSPHLGAGHILGLSDEFVHHGPHGNHLCLVFKAMGPDMSKYRRLFPKQRIPVPLMKQISRQLLLALSYLHDTCHAIHTGKTYAKLWFYKEADCLPLDIKPQNILVETSAINTMFEQAPSEVFLPNDTPQGPSGDFYME
jgi:serine/threonine-protein kinase SRPK3